MIWELYYYMIEYLLQIFIYALACYYEFSPKYTFLKSWIFAWCLLYSLQYWALHLVYCWLIGKIHILAGWCNDILSHICCLYNMTKAITTKQMCPCVYPQQLSKSKTNSLSPLCFSPSLLGLSSWLIAGTLLPPGGSLNFVLLCKE